MFALDGLRVALDDASSVAFGELDDESLSTVMVELSQLQAKLDALKANVTAAWDARRAWAADGSKSPAAWLAHRTHGPTEVGGRQVRHARHLRTLSATAEALAEGSITSAHVGRIIGVDTGRTADAVRRDEALLVGWARTLRWGEFCRRLDYWAIDNDPDGPDPGRVERRRFHFSKTFGGGWAADGWLDPINGTIIANELERREQALFEVDWREARHRLRREPCFGELRRTAKQRRADALVEMARRSAVAPTDGTPARPLITVHAGPTGLANMCELVDGTVLSSAEAASVLADAVIEVVYFETPRRVIGVSRRRSFSGAVRRAIEVRDRYCSHDTCDVPAERCQIDHIVEYASGGLTSLDNGRPLCGYHNRLRNTTTATRTARRRQRPPSRGP